MEVPRLVIVRIGRLAEKFHQHIVSATIVIVPGMKRLMKIGYEVDEVLEGLLSLLEVFGRIGKHSPKTFNLTDHALLFWTITVRIVRILVDRNVDVVPCGSLFTSDFIRPHRCLDECCS